MSHRNPVWRAVDDFNLDPRGSADDIGAYRASAGANPGSTLADDFKPSRWIFDNGFELGSTVDWSATSAP